MSNLLEKGARSMVAAGYNWRTKEMRTAPMVCGLCGKDEVFVDHDSPSSRVHVCDNCGGAKVISKGKSSWWYHDWAPLDKLPARFLERAYGKA